jgi:hypothetical protein
MVISTGLKILYSCWVLASHSCKPNYSGGRDKEDYGSKPAQANSSPDPISKKKKSQKRAGGVVQVVGP